MAETLPLSDVVSGASGHIEITHGRSKCEVRVITDDSLTDADCAKLHIFAGACGADGVRDAWLFIPGREPDRLVFRDGSEVDASR